MRVINQDLINYLIGYAQSKKIKIAFTNELSNVTPSISDVKYKNIVINLNIKNKNQIVFQLCHEIAHILCNHTSKKIFCFSTIDYGIELEANTKAIELLIPLYTYEKEKEQINLTDFMNFFGVPSRLYDIVKQQFNIFIKENM